MNNVNLIVKSNPFLIRRLYGLKYIFAQLTSNDDRLKTFNRSSNSDFILSISILYPTIKSTALTNNYSICTLLS